MSSSQASCHVENLVRCFRHRSLVPWKKNELTFALRGISFDLYPGELFGLLGPNGAGKTTMYKILSTLLLPTSGTVELLGKDIVTHARYLRNDINFAFGGERGLYWQLSGRDNLMFFATLYGIPWSLAKHKVEQLIRFTELNKVADKRVEAYSRGMKQRLHLGKALINDPKIIFLDEPTIGLDAMFAKTLRQKIRLLADEGKTIFLTTHNLFEAEELCDRIAIINHGKILAVGTADELRKLKDIHRVLEFRANYLSKERLHEIETISMRKLHVFQTETGIRATISLGAADQGEQILNCIPREDIRYHQIRSATLEDIYLETISQDDLQIRYNGDETE